MKTIYLTLDSPAVYVIRVSGILDEKWSDYLGGITILEGELIDQAALLGVLNALYDYHYPLISVERRNVGQLDREAGRGL
jgi:hypothetical protein